MAVLHFMLQGKGGVGKSTISSVLFQFLQQSGVEVFGYDTDPVNHTFASYREFNVQRINIMNGDNIDVLAFDPMIEDLAHLSAGAHAVVDNGSSSFVAMMSYLKESEIFSLLQDEHGHRIFLHSIVAGGANVRDTLMNLKSLAVNFPDTPLVVWLNPFNGPVELDGMQFEDFQIYADHRQQFHAVIDLPIGNPNTTGRDIATLAGKGHSFAAGINSSSRIVVRSRLKRYWTDLTTNLTRARLIDFANSPAPAAPRAGAGTTEAEIASESAE
jgi:hypothetical protein